MIDCPAAPLAGPSLTAMNRTTDAFLRFVPTILDNDFAGVVRPKEFRTSRSTDSHLLEAFGGLFRSEEHTSELQSLMRISYAVLRLQNTKYQDSQHTWHRIFLYT